MPIFGAGKNAATLHYGKNNATINSTDVILVDAGAEYEYYTSDITRTFPANGKFTPEAKVIYNIVLEMQKVIRFKLFDVVTLFMPANGMSYRM